MGLRRLPKALDPGFEQEIMRSTVERGAQCTVCACMKCHRLLVVAVHGTVQQDTAPTTDCQGLLLVKVYLSAFAVCGQAAVPP